MTRLTSKITIKRIKREVIAIRRLIWFGSLLNGTTGKFVFVLEIENTSPNTLISLSSFFSFLKGTVAQQKSLSYGFETSCWS